MAKDMEGRVSVVTGGNNGIGAEIAKAFAREGAKVAIFARNEETGAKVVAEIERNGGTEKF